MAKTSLSAGEKAPNLCLPDSEGNDVTLNDLKGKWVVLYFYPRDNTSGCSIEAMEFTKLKDDFEKEGAFILGVSKDSQASHKKFIEKKELGITLLSDEGTELQQSYDVWHQKKMAGKEYMGTVRTTFLIDPEGNLAKVWDKVKAKGHAMEVLDELKMIKAE
ncbi:thioredoxin-dependent thiol peroxidase [Methanococcoides burtonii]|uniref:thioredoxin-dependent peroxiredoxin n=1 Tax=Methanococcoides burtonii (strain DSM 6242 / NBRC 107633 / OCM 468 / ACE-M) TaxID=259564 RepID=Q12ZM8_METBU|nr:thioredoxin-dependent thiol peroxidase [Methanococcoides burtonii]ABE51098.1 thiol peroxidase [Methanococcoides burtonii DSM 6242]